LAFNNIIPENKRIKIENNYPKILENFNNLLTLLNHQYYEGDDSIEKLAGRYEIVKLLDKTKHFKRTKS
jgi:hypothetical protein